MELTLDDINKWKQGLMSSMTKHPHKVWVAISMMDEMNDDTFMNLCEADNIEWVGNAEQISKLNERYDKIKHTGLWFKNNSI